MLVFQCHAKPVTAVAYHPNGRELLCGGAGGIRTWCLAAGEVRAEWAALPGGIGEFTFAPDGTAVVVCGGQGKIDLRRWPDGAVLQRYDPTEIRPAADDPRERDDAPTLRRTIHHVTFSYAHRIAVGAHSPSLNGPARVYLWKVDAPPVRRHLWDHADAVGSVALAPGGRWVASASKIEGRVVIGDAATGDRVTTWQPPGPVGVVRFVDDARLLAAVGDNVVCFDVSAGRVVWTLRGHRDYVTSMTIAPDGRTLVTASADETVGVWSIPDRKLVRQFPWAVNLDARNGVAVAPDGCTAAAAGRDGGVLVWDLDPTT
ncbi:WD40 repeat domain-containing protein [Fimbriiglobus ruber]|uniref:G-protein beta WD-40 repeat n=1 Tax=Fimbriiglobus ruber TaxID=1908690 RepID=A0A225DUH9_9BACT|nr:hypothetical protein [Fimbriiglobus ruber]OWK41256.1 G-protein beta WD-40 repeat [Fimbriiglobus ruber]